MDDRGSVVRGYIGVGAVYRRLIEAGLGDPGLEVVANDLPWHPAERGQRVDRRLAQPQAICDSRVAINAAMLLPSQPQKLTYLSHRQFLAWHLDPLLLGKRSTLPSVEDCQRKPNASVISGKLYADKRYIGRGLFSKLWQRGLHLITGIRRNMRNYLMPLADK